MAYMAVGEREEPLPPTMTMAKRSKEDDAIGIIWRAESLRKKGVGNAKAWNKGDGWPIKPFWHKITTSCA